MNQKYHNFLTKELLENLIEKFKNANAISKHLKINNTTIYKYLDKFKIPRKHLKRYNYKNIFLIDNEISWYIAGFLAADGCITGSSIQIGLSQKDRDHLIKISKNLTNKYIKDYNSNILDKENNKIKACRICIGSIDIIKTLEEKFGIKSQKSLTYFIPENVLSSNLFPHFLRGYFDGDGCYRYFIENNNPKARIKICLTKKMGQQVLLYFNRLFNTTGTLGNGRINKRKIYTLEFYTVKDCQNIINHIYDNSSIYLARKKEIIDKILSIIDSPFNKFKQIKKEELIKLYEEHRSYKNLSKILNISIPTISKYFRKYGINKKRNIKKIKFIKN